MKYLAVPKLPSITEGKKTIACIGDSITFGAGVRGKIELTWEYHLEKLLGKEHQVLNYGISGRTLLSEGDYPYTEEKQYEHSRKSRADVYLIMLGTNDSKPYNWNEELFIDLHSFTGNHKEWFADGVHPNEEGNRKIADFIYREMSKKSA